MSRAGPGGRAWTGDRSGLRHDCAPGDRAAPPRARRPDLRVLLGRLRADVRSGTGGLSDGRASEARAGVRGRHLHLPDAPRDRTGGSGQLPDLWHGARTQEPYGRGGAEHRLSRYAPALLGQCGARPAAAALGHGRPPVRVRPHDPAPIGAVGAARARDPGRALGRLADPQALLGIVFEPQPEHVDPDRDRGRRRLSVQRGCDAGTRPFPGCLPRAGRPGRRLF